MELQPGGVEQVQIPARFEEFGLRVLEHDLAVVLESTDVRSDVVIIDPDLTGLGALRFSDCIDASRDLASIQICLAFSKSA